MGPRTARITSLAALLLFAAPWPPGARAAPPLTAAEKSNFQATSRHAEVVAFCEQLARESPVVRLGELGASHEGRKLPLVILADPPVATAEEAARSKKLVVFAMGNIHAGEVDGKEALLMLARDIATAEKRPLLKDLVLVFAPIFNADGNEKLGKNRPRQAGPPLAGTRANAQDLDLNRDFVKLESPEVRALVRFLNRWDPAVFIDLHTTNGSYHRYTLTYEGGRCPAGDARVIAFTRDELLPDVGQRLEKAAGYKSYFYGNFSADRSRWETVSPTPRFGTHYAGLRSRIAILSESYSYAPFKDRVQAGKAFVQGICEYTAEHKDRVCKLLAEARGVTAPGGPKPGEKDQVVIQHRPAALGRPVGILGFHEEIKDGRRVATDRPKEYEAQYMGGTEPVLSVRRPWAYLFPAGLARVVDNLQRHGIAVEELREDIELDIEVYRVDRITRSPVFQKHQPLALDATPRKEGRRVEAGMILVRTAQPLGTLAVYLLEPQSADGLATWNFFDDVLQEGKDFPVLRLPAAVPLNAGRVRPLPEDRVMNKPITIHAAADDAKPTTIQELDKLPVGLKVIHDPNPARATETGKTDRRGKYTWWFKTTVTSTGSDVKVIEFGAYAWHDGKWVFANFTGKAFSPKDFAESYSCPDAVVKEGKAYTDPTNWGSAPELTAGKARWYYIGIDEKGRRVKGEAVIEEKGEIDPKRPKDPK